MNQVDPQRIQHHRRRVKREEVPLLPDDLSAEPFAAQRAVQVAGGEFLNRAVDAADDDERGRAVEHDENGAEAFGQAACFGDAVVRPCDGACEPDLCDGLQHHGDGDERTAGLDAVPLLDGRGAGHQSAAGGGEGLDQGGEVGEEEEGAVWADRGVAGDVVHDAGEDVVLGCGVDGRAAEDEDQLGHVEVFVGRVVGEDGANDEAAAVE